MEPDQVPAGRIDSAILSDRTDNKRPKGSPVSETRATAPVFPPGRYGRRRDGRRRPLVPIVLAVLVVLASVAVAVRLYQRYGDPAYDARIVQWSDDSASRITIDFTVRVPAGKPASCVLTAQAYDGLEVGRRVVTVAPEGDGTMISASEDVPTTARASVGKVIACRPAG